MSKYSPERVTEKERERWRRKSKTYHSTHRQLEVDKMRANYYTRKLDLERTLLNRLSVARHRAKKEHLAFDLDKEWLAAQPRHCAVTGRAFELCAKGRGPFVPSFDKIDPAGGYTKHNTRIVCWWYNAAKSDDQEIQIIHAILAAADHIRSGKGIPPVVK
jgi:hypothetical protein